MNNIQLQIASLVEELLSLREGFVTFDCDNFLSKRDIIVLLNAACIEWWRRVSSIEKLSLYFFYQTGSHAADNNNDNCDDESKLTCHEQYK